MIKCSSCGAIVSKHDEVCPYCGTKNPKYSPLEKEVNTWLEKGMQAYNAEQYAKAIEDYKRVIAVAPDVFNAYFYLAASYTILKRPEEAIKAMEKAQELKPGNAPIYYNLGILCKQVGRKADARKYFEKALTLVKADPDSKEQAQFRENIEKALAEYKHWKLF